MTRPLLLDLFCGAGGAAEGYYRAGFYVVGVDNKKQKHYPFHFIQDDAVEYLHWLIAGSGGPFWIEDFAVIHASPPCQRFSALNVRWKRPYPDLITPIRHLLEVSGKPYVIENVMGAPLIDPIMLCGSAFDLGTDTHYLQRHRLFESNLPLSSSGCFHPKGKHAIGVYGKGKWDNNNSLPGTSRRGGYQGSKEEKMQAMQIDWMTLRELAQAIPPAYTEFIGKQILQQLHLPGAPGKGYSIWNTGRNYPRMDDHLWPYVSSIREGVCTS